ncbi:hypothetical protein HNY73_001030 [Argiope bruennichi]|uniref:Uncharacterized protein n=1 Tax=Argiope bruennichi TaxID=94029 RepID=A0A8T0G625_ARGBR|nr:hypothetical protein HNY73_001030 [Argiope bruennichi]
MQDRGDQNRRNCENVNKINKDWKWASFDLGPFVNTITSKPAVNANRISTCAVYTPGNMCARASIHLFRCVAAAQRLNEEGWWAQTGALITWEACDRLFSRLRCTAKRAAVDIMEFHPPAYSEEFAKRANLQEYYSEINSAESNFLE